MNLDFLKPVLGDELFQQFSEKVKGSGMTIANIADGSYIPKAKFDEQLEKVHTLQTAVSQRDEMIKAEQAKNASVDTMQAKIDQLTKDIADRDAKIKGVTRDYRIQDELRGMHFKDVNVVMPLLQQDKITEKDGKLVGLTEQAEAIKKSYPYLADDDHGGNGGRGGFDGGQDVGGGGTSTNSMMNQALRAAAGRAV